MSDKIDKARRASGVGGVPFSHVLEVDRVPAEGLDVSLSAGPDERRALADFDKISAVARLDAEFHVAPRGDGRFNVSGGLRAQVTQICVVSLEPFEAEISEPIDVDFAPVDAAHPAAAGSAATTLEGADADEPPDPIIDGRIDLGALANEFLVLGLDPYPRKPGVSFAPVADRRSPEDSPSPFDVLKTIQKLK